MATKKKSQQIYIPPVDDSCLSLGIIGKTPLISHRFSQKARMQMLNKQLKVAEGKREARNPWQEFIDSLYWLDDEAKEILPPRLEKHSMRAEDIFEQMSSDNYVILPEEVQKLVTEGRFGMPSMAFKRAAVSACTAVENVTKVAARMAFHVEGTFTPIKGEAKMRAEPAILSGPGRTPEIRFRACFPEWSAVLKINFLGNFISADQIANLVKLAGFGIGVGDWRGERNGSFGRFDLEDEK